MDCNEPVNRCTSLGLPVPPRPCLTLNSTIILAAFDAANEVTCQAHACQTQDNQEAIEISSDEEDKGQEGTILAGSREDRPDTGGETEERKQAASLTWEQSTPHPKNSQRIPLEFWKNIPPCFILFMINKGGHQQQARYITIHMENDPYALGMAGPNLPIYQLPAHTAPHPTGHAPPQYTQHDLHTLHPFYMKWLEINNALTRTRDNGLKAEVHCYCNLVDEQAQKEAKVELLNNCIADIIGETRRCVICLAQANAVKQIKEKRGITVHRISLGSFKRGHSNLGRG